MPPLIGDPDFAAGAWPFAILMAGVVAASPYLPFNQVLLMAALPGWHTGLILATTAVGFAGNLALIPLLGMRGAALAAAASLAFSALLCARSPAPASASARDRARRGGTRAGGRNARRGAPIRGGLCTTGTISSRRTCCTRRWAG